MAGLFNDLWSNFRDATKITLDINKERPVVKLLKTTVSSLENILKGIDVFLKSNGVDIKDAYAKATDKGKSLLDLAKDKLSQVKEKGYLNTAKDITSQLKDKVKGFMDTDTGPPDEEGTESNKPSLLDKGKKLLNNLKDKLSAKEENKEKTSWLDKDKERQAKRKKEIEEEKKALKDEAAKKGKASWLGKILSGIMSLGGFLIKGITGIIGPAVKGITSAVKFMGGFVVRGIGKALFGMVPVLAGNIAKGLSSLVGGGLAAAGKTAWAGVKGVAGSILPVAKTGLLTAARGAGMVLTGPVGWAIAAGAAIYGGYKLYKYLTRNNVADTIYGKLTKLRLQMYGFNDMYKEYYSKIFDLEMLMKDYTKFTNYQVQIAKLDKDIINKIMDIFSVTREEKEKYAILNNWFMKRFIPGYKSFVSALWSINNSIFLDDLDKLKQAELEEFVTKFNIPNAIFNITEIPIFDNPKTLVSKQDVDTLLVNISNEIRNKKTQGKTDTQKAAEQNKLQQAKLQNKANELISDNKKATETITPKPVQTPSSLKNIPASDQEGETKPKDFNDKTSMQQLSQKANGKLNIAQGELIPGGMDLAGISTKLDKTKIYNLDPNVRELFTGMAKEYHALTGKTIPVNEAFRSFEDQEKLYQKYPEKAAKPGNSTHEYGLAIDINQDVTEELDRLGLLRKYGFTTSIGGEKWHIEPIGVSLNPTMAKTDPNFRYKAIESSPGNGGGGYGLDSSSILKKRNIPYQLAIYNSNSENPIDLEKMKENTPNETFIVNKNTSKTVAKAPGASGSSPTMSSSTINNTTSIKPSTIALEGSTNIPKTTTPITQKETIPSLETNRPVVPPVSGNIDISKYASLGPVVAIKQAAKVVGMDENVMINFAKLESSLNPNAKAKTSSAAGLYQIVDDTWKELVKKHGAKYGITLESDRFNPYYNALMGAELAKENLTKLKGYKEAEVGEDTALYLAHFLGLNGANKFFAQVNSNPDAPVQTAVSPAAYNANKNLMQGKTVEGLLDTIDAKVSSAGGTQVASYSGNKASENKVSSSNYSSGLMNASYETPINKSSASGSKPSISSSRVDLSTPVTPQRSTTPPISTSSQNYSQMFNTGKMESILSEQLTTLTQIARLLNSMNEKFDMSKLSESITTSFSDIKNKITSDKDSKITMPNANKNSPATTIDLSRRKIVA